MADKIRVLMVTSGLALGEPLGGAERFGIELARSLDRTVFEPILCGLWRHHVPSEAYWADVLASEGIEAFFATDRARGRNPAHYLSGLRQIVRRLEGRPVHITHSHVALASLATLLLKRALGTRVLVRTALAGKEWGDGPAAWAFRQLFTQWVFPLTFDAEACVSRALVEQFDRRPGARLAGRRAHLLYNAVRLERFSRTADPEAVRRLRSELGLAPADRVVGSVGRLSPEKGYATFIAAAALVRTQRPEVKFVLVGQGPLWEPLRRQAAALGLTDAFVFAGARTDVDLCYAMMELFVLPSHWEGLPTVILESMASGTPVIATDIPGTRELVAAGHTGWLVPPDDPARLAECIVAALDAPEVRQRMAETALREVVPRFSIERIADQYEQLYLALLRR